MAKTLADIEKKLDIAQETAPTQEKRNWKPWLLVPVALVVIAGGVAFFVRRASKNSEW